MKANECTITIKVISKGSTKSSTNLLRRLCEGALELLTSPLDGVLDLVGEVLECADGDRLLRRVAGGGSRIGLGQEGNVGCGACDQAKKRIKDENTCTKKTDKESLRVQLPLAPMVPESTMGF